MKIKKETIIIITATEGRRYLALSFKGKEVIKFDSNLPYKKSIDDWDFYGRAIEKILKEKELEQK
jgi:hypothetical protein